MLNAPNELPDETALERSIHITVHKDKRDEFMAIMEDQEWIQSLNLPTGTELKIGWFEELQQREIRKWTIVIIVAAVIIYLLLGVFYESWIAPFVVLIPSLGLSFIAVVTWRLFQSSDGCPDDAGFPPASWHRINSGVIMIDRLVHAVLVDA